MSDAQEISEGDAGKKPRPLREVDKKCYERYEADSSACETLIKKFHKNYASDKKFALVPGSQWDPAARAARQNEADPRPVLEWNQVLNNNLQIINPIRTNPPGVHVTPNAVDPGNVTLATSNIAEGLLRYIEKQGAQSAFVHAFSDAVHGGLGAFYMGAEHEEDDSMDQKIVVEKVLDATTVRYDTSAKKPDFSDMMYAMIDEVMTKDAFHEEFPEIPESWYESLKDGAGRVNESAWGDPDQPIVTHYLYVETKPETLYLLTEKDEEGHAITAWESDEPSEDEIARDEDGEKISRLSSRRTVHWKKLAAGYLLEEKVWPGKNIPVYIITGRDVLIEGERDLLSATRPLKDPQVSLNYSVSSMIERAGMTPRGHWKAARGSVDAQQEAILATSHLHNKVLIYESTDTANPNATTRLPSPEYVAPENYDQALTALAQFAIEGGKMVSGQYNPSLGKSEQELSGVAIKYLDQSGNTSNADFLAHAVRAYTRLMNDILDVVPEYYSSERQLEIVGKDNSTTTVWINKPYVNKETGKTVHYDFTRRKYKCQVEIGKGYTTQLQENAEWVSGQMTSNPAIASVIPDIAFQISGEAAGVDGSLLKEGVDRIKRSLPPQLTEQDDGQEIPPQVKQQLQQAQAMLQQMQMQLQQVQAENQELTHQYALKEEELRIKWSEAETKRIIADHDAGLQGEQALLEAHKDTEIAHIKAASDHSKNLLDMKKAQDAQKLAASAAEPTGANPGTNDAEAS